MFDHDEKFMETLTETPFHVFWASKCRKLRDLSIIDVDQLFTTFANRRLGDQEPDWINFLYVLL